jgi:hypothetical protein
VTVQSASALQLIIHPTRHWQLHTGTLWLRQSDFAGESEIRTRTRLRLGSEVRIVCKPGQGPASVVRFRYGGSEVL